MSKPRSAIGRPLEELPEVFEPLRAAFQATTHKDLPTPIQKFIWFHIVDAYRAGLAIMHLVDGRRAGYEVDPFALEVLTRRVIEQAIVVSFAVTDAEGVERFFKTHEHEWERSFDRPARDLVDSDAKKLPPYAGMAEKADPELGEIWKKLSFLSHPRHSAPYSSIESHFIDIGITPDQFFDMRAMPLVDDIDIAVEHILRAWDQVKP